MTSPRMRVPSFGTTAKLMARISAPTRRADSTPPRLSTGSVVSLTWAGISLRASGSPRAIRGRVTRNTEPHQ
jgi:hypothetical protein